MPLACSTRSEKHLSKNRKLQRCIAEAFFVVDNGLPCLPLRASQIELLWPRHVPLFLAGPRMHCCHTIAQSAIAFCYVTLSSQHASSLCKHGGLLAANRIELTTLWEDLAPNFPHWKGPTAYSANTCPAQIIGHFESIRWSGIEVTKKHPFHCELVL